MEATKKTWNNNDKKKITITLGGVGGIGGVVLFVGGALVTAAFASVFVLKRIRQRPAKDRRDQRQPEIDEQRSGKEEVKQRHQIHVSSDTSLRGEQSEKETERDDDSHTLVMVGTHSSIQDEIPGTENSVGAPSSDEANEETLSSSTLRKPEIHVISNDSLFIKEGSKLYEKSSIALENPLNDEKIQLVDKDFASEVPKEETIDDDNNQVTVDDEILEMKDDSVAVYERQPTYEENVKILYCDDKEVNAGLDVENMEPQKNENIELLGPEENLGDNVEADAKKHDEIIENKEYLGSIHGSLSETVVSGSLIEDGRRAFPLPMFKNLVMTEHENTTDDVILDKTVVCESQHKTAIQQDIDVVDDDRIEDSECGEHYVDETESLEIGSEGISEVSEDSSKESNSEAVCPAEYLTESSIDPQIDDREVEGKMQEDKAIKGRGIEDYKHGQRIKNAPTMTKFAALKEDYSISSTKRRMLVATLLMLSSVSGSWFFGLSLVRLCLIAFLTMFLSEMNVC